MTQAVFEIDGMSCGGCVRKVAGTLSALPGVEVESVTIGRAQLRLDPAVTTEMRVIEVLKNAGYASRKQ